MECGARRRRLVQRPARALRRSQQSFWGADIIRRRGAAPSPRYHAFANNHSRWSLALSLLRNIFIVAKNAKNAKKRSTYSFFLKIIASPS